MKKPYIPPSKVWDCEYKHDRRKHRHRCPICNRILNEGEKAVMARVSNRTTKALHAECAEKRHIAGPSWRILYEYWTSQYGLPYPSTVSLPYWLRHHGYPLDQLDPSYDGDPVVMEERAKSGPGCPHNGGNDL